MLLAAHKVPCTCTQVPLSALTTYRAEILRHDEKERLLRTTLGATSTTSDYAVGRREGERAQGAWWQGGMTAAGC